MYISPFGKTLITIAALTLLLALALTAWVVIRGRQPMDLPAAEGITFWDFMRERWRAQKIARVTHAQLPQADPCPNRVARTLLESTARAIAYAWRSLRAETSVTASADTSLPPIQPITLSQAPDRAWAYIEAAAWQALALDAVQADTCALAPLNSQPPLIAVTGGDSAPPPTPIPTLSPTLPAEMPVVLAPGILVEVSGTEGLGLRVREQPATTAPILFKADEGQLYRVADGPVLSEEIEWWQVRALKDGSSGWVAGEYLRIIPE